MVVQSSVASSFWLALSAVVLLCAGEPAGETEVLVVGAGWAGMSAAKILAEHNVSFLVLEAHNYTGGRTHAIQFGDPSVSVNTMEIGSGWLESSGKGTGEGPEKGPPPLVTFAKSMSPPLKWSFIPGSSQNQSNYKHVYTADGHEGDPGGSIRDRANAAYACIGKCAKKSDKKCADKTVRQALNDCGWEPKTPVEKAVDWAVTVDDPGMLPEIQDLKLTLPDEVYEWWGPDDHFIIDQRPRGYAGVMDEMMKDTVPPGDKRVIFNAMVTNVAYDTKGVTVSLADGRTYKSQAAITTFPLGVLNRKHKDLFTPNVHKKLAKILDGGDFLMSNLTRIYLQFPSVFWDDEAEAFLVASADGHPGEFPEFQNLNHADRVPGSHTLLLFLGNPESVKYENMADEDVSKLVVKKLRATFPNVTVPEPVAFHMTRWGLDPLAFGCYSSLNVGFKDDSYDAITTPLSDEDGTERVYMAGEAMCDDLSGSTYGGHQSGRQIAQLYIHKNHGGEKPLDICWY